MVISRLTTKNRRPKQNIGNREFDTDVLSYDTPGVAVNYQSNGKEKSYTPDFQIVRYQKKQIIEVTALPAVTRCTFLSLTYLLNSFQDLGCTS